MKSNREEGDRIIRMILLTKCARRDDEEPHCPRRPSSRKESRVGGFGESTLLEVKDTCLPKEATNP